MGSKSAKLVMSSQLVKTAFIKISNDYNNQYISAMSQISNEILSKQDLSKLAIHAITYRNRKRATILISQHADLLSNNQTLFDLELLYGSLITSIQTMHFSTNFFKSRELNNFSRLLIRKYGRLQEYPDEEVDYLLMNNVNETDILELISKCQEGEQIDGEIHIN